LLVLRAQVASEGKEVVNKARNDGKRVRIVECLVGDASASITFAARDDQGAPLPLYQVHLLVQSADTLIASSLIAFGTLFPLHCAAELMQPGITLVIRNGRVDMFKGVMRLSVDKWGKLERAANDDSASANFQPNTANNLSATVYELVPMDEQQ
jgi:replication factor A1